MIKTICFQREWIERINASLYLEPDALFQSRTFNQTLIPTLTANTTPVTSSTSPGSRFNPVSFRIKKCI